MDSKLHHSELWLIIMATTLHMKEVLPCSESEFYTPYAKVKAFSSGDETLSEIIGSGFLDLSKTSGASLCINGPAIVYTEARLNETGDIGEYYKGHLSLYVHNCLPLNELVSIARRKSNRSTIPKPKKVEFQAYGVTLVGNHLDYRKELIYQFNHPSFGHYANGQTVNGNSFVLIGDTCWCTTLPGKNPRTEVDDITICRDSHSGTLHEICTVRGEDYKDFTALFTKKTETNSYSWIRCNRNDKFPISNKPAAHNPGHHSFEQFALIVNSTSQNQLSHGNSKPRVRHCWKIDATECFEIPHYWPGTRC